MTCKFFDEENRSIDICFNTRLQSYEDNYTNVEAHLPSSGFQEAYETISRWPDYEPTPLIQLKNLAEILQVATVEYKNEALRFGLMSFKALGGAYAVHKCLSNLKKSQPGLSNSDVTFTSATDGNHGRAVAWGAKLLGCKSVIFIHEKVSEFREKKLEELGAKVIRKGSNYDESVNIANDAAIYHGWHLISDTSYEGYTDVPKYVMHGYEVMAHEALKLQGCMPTHVFLQTGVGSLAGAITANLLRNLTYLPHIVLVDPSEADCWVRSVREEKPTNCNGELNTIMAGLACGTVSKIAWNILSTSVSAAMSIADTDAANGMRCLKFCKRQNVNIEAGESATAGLVGMIKCATNANTREKLKVGKDSRILIIGSEGKTDPKIYEQIIRNKIAV